MPSETDRRRGFAALYEEHLLLGAQFGSDSVVKDYGADVNIAEALSGAVLSDISDVCLLLFSGAPSNAFASMAFAGDELGRETCGFEAVLTGDGALASVPLLARTGSHEFIALDLSKRADVLSAWLSFLSSVSQNGVEPFAGMQTQDASEKHVALLLMGDQAPVVIEDYLADARLPSAGEVRACKMDEFPCIIVSPAIGDVPCYVILVPPVHAVALWRSLLSFTNVTPVGRDAVRCIAHEKLPWSRMLEPGDRVRRTPQELEAWGILRHDETYVGARGLYATQE